jgi:hypothetical protein
MTNQNSDLSPLKITTASGGNSNTDPNGVLRGTKPLDHNNGSVTVESDGPGHQRAVWRPEGSENVVGQDEFLPQHRSNTPPVSANADSGEVRAHTQTVAARSLPVQANGFSAAWSNGMAVSPDQWNGETAVEIPGVTTMALSTALAIGYAVKLGDQFYCCPNGDGKPVGGAQTSGQGFNGQGSDALTIDKKKSDTDDATAQEDINGVPFADKEAEALVGDYFAVATPHTLTTAAEEALQVGEVSDYSIERLVHETLTPGAQADPEATKAHVGQVYQAFVDQAEAAAAKIIGAEHVEAWGDWMNAERKGQWIEAGRHLFTTRSTTRFKALAREYAKVRGLGLK